MDDLTDAAAIRALRQMPNVGPSIARDLLSLGIRQPADLKRRNPKRLYDQLCALTGQRHDPCVLDTFMAAVAFAETGVDRKWWEFTPTRKRRFPLI